MPPKGFIYLWRKAIDTGMLKNHLLWAFWTWCLLKASHTKHTTIVGYQEVQLQPGQLIFGRKNAANELGTTERKIRTCLQNLIKDEKVTIKTTNKYSIITVSKWEEYQNKKSNKPTSNRPATDQQPTTNNNGNNDNNIYNSRFEEFWGVYPKKVGKGAALKEFTKIKPSSELLAKMVESVNNAKLSQQWKKDNGQFVPNPATWLHQERWEDEYKVESMGDLSSW